MSWVFGPDRPSFVDQILKRAQETEDLSAIADKWAVPTTRSKPPRSSALSWLIFASEESSTSATKVDVPGRSMDSMRSIARLNLACLSKVEWSRRWR
jgi:hypothetical protein